MSSFTNNIINSSKDISSNANATEGNIDKTVHIMNFHLNKECMTSTETSSTKKMADSDQDTNSSVSNAKTFIHVYHNDIPSVVRKKAKLELGETDENVRKGITTLKDYLKKEKYPPVEDGYLMACLRVSKYDMKKAQEKLKRYCDLRCKLAKKFEKLNVETARELIRKTMVGYFPYRDEAGRAIFFTRGDKWRPEICDLDETFLVTYMMIFHLVSLPITSISGIRFLCDLKISSYNQYYLFYKIIKDNLFIVNTLPVRLHADCVHDDSVIHTFYNLLRPVLPAKLAKRLNLHGYNYESLQKEIDISILPEEYGGTMGPLNSDFLMENFEEFFHKFKAENRMYIRN